MLTFKSPIVAEAILDGNYPKEYLDGDHWILKEPLIIDLGLPGKTDDLIIPAGFVTDFGSIPWFIPEWIANRQGKAKRAYAMHDYLYQNLLFTELVDDALLNEGMIVDGVNWWQRFTVFRGLRLGGWYTWNKYAQAKKASDEKKAA